MGKHLFGQQATNVSRLAAQGHLLPIQVCSEAYKAYLEKHKPIPGQLMVASARFQADRV